MKNIPYGHQSISSSDIKSVVRALKSDYLTQGPLIVQFENAISNYVNSTYAVVFNSGTAALHAAYFVAGLSVGDELITSPITFAATSNAVLYLGAKPVFVDIQSNTGLIDPDNIENKITKKTKIIVPVHYAGFPVDLEKIHRIAQKYKLLVIEDACHALGATYKRSTIGDCRYSDMSVFSFHPVKHITTGEGGAVTTNNRKYYELLLMFRSHGITKNPKKYLHKNEGDWYHEMQILGFNYRITDFQAALGLSQLKRLPAFLKKRRLIAKQYDKAFKHNPYFDIISESSNSHSAYHLYPIILKDKYIHKKKEIFSYLRKRGLGVQVHYIPVYQHPFYTKLGYKKGMCPSANSFYQSEISIPIYSQLCNSDIKRIIHALKNII